MNQSSSRELRIAVRRARRRRDTELNIVSMIDVLTVLVFFLLVNSISVSTLGVKLPDSKSAAKPPPHALSVVVRANGLTLSDNSQVISHYDKTGQKYDLDGLADRLRQIKDKAPQESNISLRLEYGIPYETLIAVMDAVRSSADGPHHSERDLFPDIAIGEAITPGGHP